MQCLSIPGIKVSNGYELKIWGLKCTIKSESCMKIQGNEIGK